MDLTQLTQTELTAVVTGFVILGGLIVKATPTKKDDEWWSKFKKLLGMAVLLAFVMPAAVSHAGIFEDGTIDLKILKIGKSTAVDVGFAGAGIRVDTENGWEIDAEPTFFDVKMGMCRWDWLAGKLGGFCGDSE